MSLPAKWWRLEGRQVILCLGTEVFNKALFKPKDYRALITSVTINKAHPIINNRPTIFLAAVTKSNIK